MASAETQKPATAIAANGLRIVEQIGRPLDLTNSKIAERLQVTKYKWVTHNGVKLYQVGILADGTLHNPNGYAEEEVRAAVESTNARIHARRSAAA